MPEKVVAKLTKEEVERSYYFLRKENQLSEQASRLLDKRAELERERMELLILFFVGVAAGLMALAVAGLVALGLMVWRERAKEG